jgi:hypothetical protein
MQKIEKSLKRSPFANLMFLKKLSLVSESQLHKIITLLAVILTCQVIYIQHGWINDDSVLYFEMARLFSIGEWGQGIAHFNWPLYPALISAVHQLTQLEIQTSAQVLNVLFFTITTYSFISLIKLAGGNKTTIICGGFLLLSSAYIVGDVLPMLLRDQGFWAMFLSSLVYFVRFYRDRKISDALLWQICAILAMLFRIEAITYLAIMPFMLLKQRELQVKQTLKHFFQINIIPIFILSIITGVLLIVPSVHLDNFGRLQEAVTIFPRILTDIAQVFKTKANIMSNEVLGGFFDNFGMMGIIVSLAFIIIFKVISLIGWPVAGIMALNRHISRHNGMPAHTMQGDTQRILRWVVLLALLNAAVIIASVFVLSGRYIIALGLILLIFAAFHLASLIEKIRLKQIEKPWEKILLFIFLALLTFSAVKNTLPKRAGYNFEQDAVAYLKRQQIPNEKVFFITPRSRYYAGAPFAGRGYDYWDYTQAAIIDGSIYQYDYLAINLDIDDRYTAREKILNEKLPQYKLAKEFYGLRNKKKIMLFKKK